MSSELPKQYDPRSIEATASARWLDGAAFAAQPDDRERRYVIMMPLPNVTGALHMGHAMDNVMQDLLTRWHRMQGDNTLWMAGTDHAGIGTQAVVEKRIFELEGKSRHDIGRDELVRRIWQWKDQYQARIVAQQQAMGCGCDWDRQRFTMDAVCARAVRHTFFRMFRDGLIYQGNRLVNWDCHLQTAVADDELYRETVQGHFYHLRYPVIDPQPGEPDHVVVATTRPETMLGDTAVACHADPRGRLQEVIAETEARLAQASTKDRPDLEAELARLRERMTSHIPLLERIAAMARAGRKVRLPLLERPIPILCDEWAKPELGSGCVKITPAHDPNDYDVWTRHRDEIDIINVLAPDGTLNAEAGSYQGLDRFEARDRVVADLQARSLVERIEDREIEIEHSDRSKTVVEPYLSKQWFVRMGDVEGGVVCGRGTPKEFTTTGLAQAAIDAASGSWRSATGRQVAFHPDQRRYHKIYYSWLAEKRDWCISRQLWWGHRIPVWSGDLDRDQLLGTGSLLAANQDRDDVAAWVVLLDEAGNDSRRVTPQQALELAAEGAEDTARVRVLLCFLDPEAEQRLASLLEGAGLQTDPDVLDTWFSSALWPHSTLGWPDPTTAEIDPGQSPLAADDEHPDALSYYYPGSCLVTGRDIITLWVARMVVAGLYNLGDVPFTDVFLHANILDGRGDRMSKSKGNGVDPMDMIQQYGADAMRYVLCEMQTGTQDIRLPVQAKSPFVEGEVIDMTKVRPSRHQGCFIDPNTGKEFDMVGLMADQGVPAAKALCERFEVGRNFCNKLWNAARFAFLNLEDASFEPLGRDRLALEDRWILSRLASTIETVQASLEAYNPSQAINAARDFFWNELCDWYLEFIKPRMRDHAEAGVARQVLATALDQVLRLLHPFVPFLTEILWSRLDELAPRRGVGDQLPDAGLLARAPWPQPQPSWRDEGAETALALARDVVTKVREIRARHAVPPSAEVEVVLVAPAAARPALEPSLTLMAHTAHAASVKLEDQLPDARDAATALAGEVQIAVLGVIDVAEEKRKLQKERDQLRQRLESVQKKLANEGFLAKAPAEVVERERGNLTAYESQLSALEQRLHEL